MSKTALARLALLWLAASTVYFSITDYPFTPDSYAYVAAAGSLVARGDLTVPFAPSRADSLPVPYSAWPPGYPAAIAAATGLGLNAWTAARLWSLAGVATAVLILLLRLRESKSGTPALALVVLSWPLAQFAARAWSEGIFVAFACGCLWAIDRWRQDAGRQMRHLALALTCAGAASLCRYSGLFLLPPLAWIVWRSGLSIRRLAGLWGCLVAATPLGLWLWRNSDIAPGWRGAIPHAPEWWRAPAEFCRALGEISLGPPGVSAEIQALLGAVVAVSVTLLIVRHCRSGDRGLWPRTAALFALSFAAGLMVSRAFGLAGPLTPRLVWPAFMFAVVASAPALVPHSARARRLGGVGLSLWIALQSLAVIAAPRVYPSLEQRLQGRALPPFVNDQPALLANRGWVVWRRTGRLTYYVPFRPHENGLLGVDSLSRWAGQRGVRYLIWYDEGGDTANQQSLYGGLPGVIAAGGTQALVPVWRGDSVTVLRIASGG